MNEPKKALLEQAGLCAFQPGFILMERGDSRPWEREGAGLP